MGFVMAIDKNRDGEIRGRIQWVEHARDVHVQSQRGKTTEERTISTGRVYKYGDPSNGLPGWLGDGWNESNGNGGVPKLSAEPQQPSREDVTSLSKYK